MQLSALVLKNVFLWRCGRRGATNVHLASAKKKMLQTALNAAWKNVTAKLKMTRKKKS